MIFGMVIDCGEIEEIEDLESEGVKWLYFLIVWNGIRRK